MVSLVVSLWLVSLIVVGRQVNLIKRLFHEVPGLGMLAILILAHLKRVPEAGFLCIVPLDHIGCKVVYRHRVHDGRVVVGGGVVGYILVHLSD